MPQTTATLCQSKRRKNENYKYCRVCNVYVTHISRHIRTQKHERNTLLCRSNEHTDLSNDKLQKNEICPQATTDNQDILHHNQMKDNLHNDLSKNVTIDDPINLSTANTNSYYLIKRKRADDTYSETMSVHEEQAMDLDCDVNANECEYISEQDETVPPDNNQYYDTDSDDLLDMDVDDQGSSNTE